ncbi:DUF2784 domain-containing protein [Saccharothrix violaceirubra]|uniref:DUF2784 domain-containing protein n=1 Tax=Saccharothrix violaceirubra TaxID=413306 RepID=A0A7W7WZD4_9PSEU|nr:DUF2784 domain-containing protein [Saccharothrix violaceirubra]MBB4969469.1 hypothetical protein [Saccharothrix violaceirubra]
MVTRSLAELVMVLHFAVLLFLVVGGYLAWRLPKVLYAHVAMAAWAVLIVAFPVSCPLTSLENTLRVASGAEPLARGGFIDTYIDGVLYPESAAPLVQVLVGLAVLTSWVGWFARRAAPARACG